jgi:tRNA dimethylallyltransferase
MPGRLLIILGPTAVGKTDFAISKALEVGSPVISCDSRQIFREMSIGTAVPSPEQLAAVKHYFIQTRSVTENYTAGDYEVDALALIRRLFAEGHETLVMTGGSMFYIDAVCGGLDSLPQVDPAIRAGLMERLRAEGPGPLAEELHRRDPASYETLELTNGQRVVRALEVCIGTGKPFSSFKTGQRRQREFSIEKIGLNRPRAELYARIDRRVLQMMEAGLLEEAKAVYPKRALNSLQTVGYKELFAYLDGEYDLHRAIELIQQNSRHYAKRQLTWFRRDNEIHWLNANDDYEKNSNSIDGLLRAGSVQEE